MTRAQGTNLINDKSFTMGQSISRNETAWGSEAAAELLKMHNHKDEDAVIRSLIHHRG